MTAPAGLRLDPRFRHLIKHLHALGPVGELLLARRHGPEAGLLERYRDLDPAVVAMVDARRWPPLPHKVA